MAKDSTKTEILNNFMKKARIIVVDRSTSSRTRLSKTLIDLGAMATNILRFSSLQEAQTVMGINKPDIVLCDYKINGGTGFDLFKYHREKFADSKNSIFVLVTANISQSAVAKAAEEDVDSFIIKPYTINIITENLKNAVFDKLYPSDYALAIEDGKNHMMNSDYTKALEIFKNAEELSKNPSLALYYEGMVKKLLHKKEEAVRSFQKGLSVNHIHYKCQIGLFEIYLKNKQFYEAYEVSKKISKYFPANHERLKTVVRLAIITENFEDMEYYYDIFKSLDERTDLTTKYICAGLYICGKFNMNLRDYDKAFEVFEKVAISCRGNKKFLTAIIEILCSKNYVEEAQKYITRFPDGSDDSTEYLISKLWIDSKTKDSNFVITSSLEIYQRNIRPYQLYKILIQSFFDSDLSEKANKYINEAMDKFPKKKDDILSLAI